MGLSTDNIDTWLIDGIVRVMEFLEKIVKELVAEPGQVRIDRSVDEMGVLLTLYVSQNDMGRVIGRGGSTAKALRTILMVWGMAREQRLHLRIVDPPGVKFVKRPMDDIDEALKDI